MWNCNQMRLQMFLLWNAGTKKQIIEYSFILITRSKMRNHISYSCFFRDRCIRIVLVPLNTLYVYGGLWNMGFMWKRFNKKSHYLLLYYWCVRHFCCRCFTSNPCSWSIHVDVHTFFCYSSSESLTAEFVSRQ